MIRSRPSGSPNHKFACRTQRSPAPCQTRPRAAGGGSHGALLVGLSWQEPWPEPSSPVRRPPSASSVIRLVLVTPLTGVEVGRRNALGFGQAGWCYGGGLRQVPRRDDRAGRVAGLCARTTSGERAWKRHACWREHLSGVQVLRDVRGCRV